MRYELLVIFGVVVLLWPVCGFLAYGLLKGLYYVGIKNKSGKYTWRQEEICRFHGSIGIIGLLVVPLIYHQTVDSLDIKRWYFCLKMPKEYCE